MAGCGDRAKARAYRARLRDTGGTGDVAAARGRGTPVTVVRPTGASRS